MPQRILDARVAMRRLRRLHVCCQGGCGAREETAARLPPERPHPTRTAFRVDTILRSWSGLGTRALSGARAHDTRHARDTHAIATQPQHCTCSWRCAQSTPPRPRLQVHTRARSYHDSSPSAAAATCETSSGPPVHAAAAPAPLGSHIERERAGSHIEPASAAAAEPEAAALSWAPPPPMPLILLARCCAPHLHRGLCANSRQKVLPRRSRTVTMRMRSHGTGRGVASGSALLADATSNTGLSFSCACVRGVGAEERAADSVCAAVGRARTRVFVCAAGWPTRSDERSWTHSRRRRVHAPAGVAGRAPTTHHVPVGSDDVALHVVVRRGDEPVALPLLERAHEQTLQRVVAVCRPWQAQARCAASAGVGRVSEADARSRVARDGVPAARWEGGNDGTGPAPLTRRGGACERHHEPLEPGGGAAARLAAAAGERHVACDDAQEGGDAAVLGAGPQGVLAYRQLLGPASQAREATVRGGAARHGGQKQRG